MNSLVSLLVGDLSPNDRQKIMTLCTIDVHSRDVVARLVAHKVESSQAFAWQSQLRHRYKYILPNLELFDDLKGILKVELCGERLFCQHL